MVMQILLKRVFGYWMMISLIELLLESLDEYLSFFMV